MREILKPLLLFSVSELSIFTIIIGASSIVRGMQPHLGGHDFENGGVAEFAFGMTIAAIICAIHSSIFTVSLLAARKLKYLSVIHSPKMSVLCGAIFSLSLFISEHLQNVLISLFILPITLVTILIVGLSRHVQSKSI